MAKTTSIQRLHDHNGVSSQLNILYTYNKEVIVWSQDPFVNKQFQDFSKLIVVTTEDKQQNGNVLGQVYEYYIKEKEQFNYIVVLYGLNEEINCLKLLTVCMGIFKNVYIYGNSNSVNSIQEFAQDIDSTIECFQLDHNSFSALFNKELQDHEQMQQQSTRRIYCSMQDFKGYFNVLTTNENIKDIYYSLQIKIGKNLLNFRKDELKVRIKQSPLTKQQFQTQRNKILAEQIAELHKESTEGNVQIIERFQQSISEVKEYNNLLTNSKCSYLILKEFQFFENKKGLYKEYEEFEEDIDLFYQFYMENCPNYANKKLIILEFLTKVLKEGAKEFIEKSIQQNKYHISQKNDMTNTLAQEKENYYENIMQQAQEQIEQLQKDNMENKINYEKNLEQIKEMSNLEIDQLQEKIRLLETSTRKKDNVLRDSLNKYDKDKMIFEQKIHFQELEIMELKQKIKSQLSFNQFLNENKFTQTDENIFKSLNKNEEISNSQHLNQKMDIPKRDKRDEIQNDDNIPQKDNFEQNSNQRNQDLNQNKETERYIQEIKELKDLISQKDFILMNLQQQNKNLQNLISSMKKSNNGSSIGEQKFLSSENQLSYNSNIQQNQKNDNYPNSYLITPPKQQLQFSSEPDQNFKGNNEDKFLNQDNNRLPFDNDDIHQIVGNLILIDEDLERIVNQNQVGTPQLHSSSDRSDRDKQISAQQWDGNSEDRDKIMKLELYVAELNQYIEDQKNDIQEQNEQIIQQQEEIQYMKKQSNIYEMNLQQYELKIQEYKLQLQQNKLKFQEYEQIIIGMNENQVEQLMKECQKMNEIIQQKTAEQNQCLTLLQQQQFELDIKKKQIISFDNELSETSKRIEEQDERIKEKDEQLFEIFQQNQRLSNENIVVQQELQTSIKQRDELKGILDICKNKISQIDMLERQLTEQKQFIEQQDRAYFEQQEHFSQQVQQIQIEIRSSFEQELIEKNEQIIHLNNELQQSIIMIQQLQNSFLKQENSSLKFENNSLKFENDKTSNQQQQQKIKNNNNYIFSTYSSDSQLNKPYLMQQSNLKLSDFQNPSNIDQSSNSARCNRNKDRQLQSVENQQQKIDSKEKISIKIKQEELNPVDLTIGDSQEQQSRIEESLFVQNIFESRNIGDRNSRKNLSIISQMKNSNINNNQDNAKQTEEVHDDADIGSHRECGAQKKDEKSFSSTSRFSNLNSDILEIQSQNQVDEQNSSKLKFSNIRTDNDRFSLPAKSSNIQSNNNSDLDLRAYQKHEFSIQKLCQEGNSFQEGGRSNTEHSCSQFKLQQQQQRESNPQKELSFQDNHDDIFVNSNTYGQGNTYKNTLINSERNRGNNNIKQNQDISIQNKDIVVNKQNKKQELLQDFLFSDVETDNEYKQNNPSKKSNLKHQSINQINQFIYKTPISMNQTPQSANQTPNSSYGNLMKYNNSKKDLNINNQNQEMVVQQLKLLKNFNANSGSNSKRYQQGYNTENSSSHANIIQDNTLSGQEISINVHPADSKPPQEKLQYRDNIFRQVGQKGSYLPVPPQPSAQQGKSLKNPLSGQIIGQSQEQRNHIIKPQKFENNFYRVSSQNALDILQDNQIQKLQYQKSESLHPSPLNQSNHKLKQSNANQVTPNVNEFDLKMYQQNNEIHSPSQNKQYKSQKQIQSVTNNQQISSDINKQNHISILNSSNSHHNLSHVHQQNVYKLGTTDLFEDIFPSIQTQNTIGNRERFSKENKNPTFNKIQERRKESNSLVQFENDIKVIEENIFGSTHNNVKSWLEIGSIFSQRKDIVSNNKRQSSLGIFDNLQKKDLFGKSYLSNESIKQQERSNEKQKSGSHFNLNQNYQSIQVNSIPNKVQENKFQFNLGSATSSNNTSNLNTSRHVTPINERKNSFFQSILSAYEEKPSHLNSNKKNSGNTNVNYSPYSSVNSVFNKSIISTNIQPILKETPTISYQSNLNKTSQTNNYQSLSPNDSKKHAGRTYLTNFAEKLSNKKNYSSFVTNFNSKIQ